MDTASKYEIQKDHAAEILGIKQDQSQWVPTVYIGNISGESLTLAKAIKDLAPDIVVFGIGIKDSLLYILENDTLILGYPNSDPIYSLRETSDLNVFHGNHTNFSEISGDKILTSKILSEAGIDTPSEISLFLIDENRGGGNKREGENIEMVLRANKNDTHKVYQEINRFKNKIGQDKKIIIKPNNGCGGDNVHVLDYDDINEYSNEGKALYINDLLNPGLSESIIQEKIDSSPIIENHVRKDWNLRVLTTVDNKGKVIVAGITGRIDNEGKAINRSLTAENISFDEIAEKIQWSSKEKRKLLKRIHTIAIKSVETLIEKSNYKPLFSQDLAGVDIIVDENMIPYVIEVNDSDSGCIYELMLLEGIESIYPIAEAVIRKVRVITQLKYTTGIEVEDFYEIVNNHYTAPKKISFQERFIKALNTIGFIINEK